MDQLLRKFCVKIKWYIDLINIHIFIYVKFLSSLNASA